MNCYQQSQAQQQGRAVTSPVDPLQTGSPGSVGGGGGGGGGAGGGGGGGGATAADYYGQAQGGYGAGPAAGCYSPQQYASQYMQQSSPSMIDYTQLHSVNQQHQQHHQQHQRLQAAAAAAAAGAHLQHLQHHGGGGLVGGAGLPSPGGGAGAISPISAALSNNNNGGMPSAAGVQCKYEVTATATPNGISSPQDLTTSAPPGARSPPPVMKSVRGSSAVAVAGASPAAQGPVSQTSSSPASSISSTSSNGGGPGGNGPSSGGGGGGKGGSGQNPPQIYPWMKRVHLGQSEYILHYIPLRAFGFPLNWRTKSQKKISSAVGILRRSIFTRLVATLCEDIAVCASFMFMCNRDGITILLF